MNMSRFIHEGTGDAWKNALLNPENQVRWIILRDEDLGDLTYRLIDKSKLKNEFVLVGKFEFANVYERKNVAGVKIE